MKLYAAIVTALAIAGKAQAAAAAAYRGSLPFPATAKGSQLLSYNETTPAPAARLRPNLTSVEWALVGAGQDEQYFWTDEAGNIVRYDISAGRSSILLQAHELPDDLRRHWISSDGARILFAVNATKTFRDSYRADYLIMETAGGGMRPLVEDQAGDVQFARFSPAGDSIVFARGNDLYVRVGGGGGGNATVRRITSTGGPDIFNGLSDWVYMEEVLSTPQACWYSPDGKYIAYLSINDTGVGTFTVPYYMAGQKIAPAYPKELPLRYPKVGTTNPRVSLHLVQVATAQSRQVPLQAFGEDTIIGQVTWMTDTHDKLIYRAFNRVQDRDKHVLVDTATLNSRVVRERDGRDGWLENEQSMKYVGPLGTGYQSAAYYIDKSDESGWYHLYLHPVDGGGASIQLTHGDWDVRVIIFVDKAKKRVVFTAAKQHSTEQHLYSVSWETMEMQALVDDTKPAYFDASFSVRGGYYILTYNGPDIPYQQLFSASNATSLLTLQSNEELYRAIQRYKLPQTTYLELQHPEGFSLNVKQMLPANFDPQKKYPVLFTPYGGPSSQLVAKTYSAVNWAAYIASDPELEYITYTVDSRGTAGKGREFRSAVTGQLGTLEAADQIWAARTLAARFPYLNADRFGMWGWSYGGFLAAKTIEADSGAFSFALITAPVTDFRLYDSVYTERYMKRLDDNKAGYERAAVRNPAGFHNVAGSVAVMHGSGDDNVHYQNTAALVDLLVGANVSPAKLRLMVFTDSDHGIDYDGASTFLYRFLTARLWDEVQRREKTLVHQWGRRKG